jgi:hypothetical protein
MQFHSILELQCHYQDVRCIPLPKRPKPKPNHADQADAPPAGDVTRGGLEFHVATQESFKRKRDLSDSESTESPSKRHRKFEQSEPSCSMTDSGYSSPSNREDYGSQDTLRADSRQITTGVGPLPSHAIDPRLFEFRCYDSSFW